MDRTMGANGLDLEYRIGVLLRRLYTHESKAQTERTRNLFGFLFMYAGHAPVLGGVSPLRGREPPPLSNGKGVSVRRGLKEAGATATT